MSSELLLALSALGGLACVGLLLLAIVQWKRAVDASRRLAWLEAQLNRALDQINTNDEEEILAGCQVLTVLNDRPRRVRAIKRLMKLMKDDNPRVARQAGITYENIVASLTGPDHAPRSLR